jgi:hypothetical protein
LRICTLWAPTKLQKEIKRTEDTIKKKVPKGSFAYLHHSSRADKITALDSLLSLQKSTFWGGNLSNNSNFITLQIDGQSPSLLSSDNITRIEAKVRHPMTSSMRICAWLIE